MVCVLLIFKMFMIMIITSSVHFVGTIRHCIIYLLYSDYYVFHNVF